MHCKSGFDISEHPKGWMANHVRWCLLNPKRTEYKNGTLAAITAMNKSKNKSGRTNQFQVARIEGRPVPKGNIGNTIWLGRSHSEKTKSTMRESALKSKHRRLVRSMRDYIKLDGSVVKLDSSWEERLAKRLDFLGVDWIRPEPLEWVDKFGRTHNYFADFYLPNYNVYLDPKNKIAFSSQIEKIIALKQQFDNIFFLCSEIECDNYNPNNVSVALLF